jgi:pimeloyl-ACP methyl ester carboxylesterase
MPHADVNGQRLYYEDSGEGETAIVFSHGYLMDHSMFDAQAAALRDDYRVIAWDERGHGETETTPDPFTYWDSASDVLGLLDELGIEQAVLAGMSQGGFLSMRAALTAPDRVKGLVLIDTQAGTEDPEKLPGYDQLIEAWVAPGGPPQEVLDTVTQIIIGPGYEDTPAWHEKWRGIGETQMRQIYATLTGRDEIWDRLGEISQPTLVVHGDQDIAIELPIGQKLAESIDGADIAVVPGAGHAANMTHPDQVNPAIRRFLESLS